MKPSMTVKESLLTYSNYSLGTNMRLNRQCRTAYICLYRALLSFLLLSKRATIHNTELVYERLRKTCGGQTSGMTGFVWYITAAGRAMVQKGPLVLIKISLIFLHFIKFTEFEHYFHRKWLCGCAALTSDTVIVFKQC